MIIRVAEQSDLEGILELYRELNPEDPGLPGERASALWKTICSEPFFKYFVAVEQDRIVSTCNISIIPNLTRGGRPFAVIENVITDEKFRNRGIGAEVVRAAVDCARSSGCYKVMLLSGIKRKAAHRFYEKLGFNGNSKKGFDMRFE